MATINGTAGNDSLSGNSDNDTLNGLGGDDVLSGGNGDDSVVGGAGNDTLSGDNGNDTLRGGSGNDVLLGGDGRNDRLYGGADADTIDGGNGEYDIADYRDSDAAININLANGTATGGYAEGDVFRNVESYIGSDHDDTLVGSDGDDRFLQGWSGNDFISGGEGDDNLLGHSGDDTLIGGNGDDNLQGGSGANLLQGGLGNDDLYVNGGENETIDGGDGLDRLTLGPGGGIANLAAGTVGQGASASVVMNVENLSGGSGNDTLIGDSGSNRLDGWFGDDLLQGGAGDDMLVDNLGGNTLEGGMGNDTLLGYDLNQVLRGGDGNDILRSVAGNDTLSGGNGDDSITSGSGTDDIIFEAGWGNDTIADYDANSDQLDLSGTGLEFTDLTISQQNSDALIEDASGNSILLQNSTAADITAVDLNLAASVNGVQSLTGTAGDDSLSAGACNDTLSGLDGDDTLSGGGGDDTLLGGNGDDLLIGGTGSDTLNGGDGIDTASYSGSASGVNVSLINQSGQIIQPENAVAAEGKTTEDTSSGCPICGRFHGYGPEEDSAVGDFASGGAAEGDTLISIENLIGSGFNDILTGDSGNNVLTGGAGNDQFTFLSGWGDDTITDFEDGTDTIRISIDGAEFADLTISQQGSDTLVEYGSGNSILLAGVNAISLTAEDFTFGLLADDINDIRPIDFYSTGTGNRNIDSLLMGNVYSEDASGGSFTLTYSFPTSESQYSSSSYGSSDEPYFNLQGMTPAQQALFEDAFDYLSTVTNLVFVEVPDTGTSAGTIRPAWTDISAPGVLAWAYYPWQSQSAGDIWFMGRNLSPNDPDFDTILLHELGHAIGLKHPFQTRGSWPTIESQYNGWDYTVMAYAPSGRYSGATSADLSPTTFMRFDILALQHLYGENFNASGDDDEYIFDLGERYYMTIWDAGGTDTIRVVGGNTSVALTLAIDGTWLNVGTTVTYSNGSTNWNETETVYLLEGSVIENASGANGDDTIAGNCADNLLEGNGGDDILAGDSGDDTLVGGAGADTLSGGSGNDDLTGGNCADVYQFADGWGADTISDFEDGSDSIDLRGTSVSDFSDLTIADIAGGALVTDGNGNSIFVAGVAAADLTSADFLIGDLPITGTSGNDLITGTDAAENISALGGNDTVRAGGGNDDVTGGTGGDSILGGTGADTLAGGGDNDTLVGGTGNDQLAGDGGSDIFSFSAGDGDDTISDFQQGTDLIDLANTGLTFEELTITDVAGGACVDYGGDTILLQGISASNLDFNDFILSGDDEPIGGTGTARSMTPNSTYRGTIEEGGDDDWVAVELIAGGIYDISLNGISLSDPYLRIYDSSGALVAQNDDGGPGLNSFLSFSPDSTATYYISARAFSGSQTGTYEITVDVDFLPIVGTGNADSITGTANADDISALSGNDTVRALAGDDTVRAGDGNDDIDGGAGHDVILGGNGDDIIAAGTGNDDADGGEGRDTLSGGVGQDSLKGGDGNDQLDGGADSDSLRGGNGDDTLMGGNGDDTLTAGTGNDTLTGGAGADRFFIAEGDGSDTITDFEQGADIIDIRSFGTTYADMSISQQGSDALIDFGNGDSLLLQNTVAANLDESDFLFGVSVAEVLGITNPWYPLPDVGFQPAVTPIAPRNLTEDLTVGADEILFGQGNSTLLSSWSLPTLTNNGLIWNEADGTSRAIGGSNWGNISNTGDIVSLSSNGTAHGVYVGSWGILQNSGNVTAISANGDAVAYATWSSMAWSGGDSTNLNTGEITAWSGTGQATGMQIVNGGDLQNDGSILVSGFDGAIGISAGRYATITNTGSITAVTGDGNTDSVGISTTHLGHLVTTITNSGTITADIAIQTTIGFSPRQSATNVVVNSATITGDIMLGWGDDQLTNTGDIVGNIYLDANDDYLDSSGGNIDGTIDLGTGDDTVIGSDRNDTILGGAGNDILSGGNGDDDLTGGTGTDIFAISQGADTVADFEDGVDYLRAADGSANIDAFTITQSGNDVIVSDGSGGTLRILNANADDIDAADLLSADINLIGGTDGDDNLTGTANSDRILAGTGNDTAAGAAGDDTVNGGEGNDDISGGLGADILIGGDGDDTLTGGDGTDNLAGGAGADVFMYDNDWGFDFISDFDPASDILDFTGLGAFFSYDDLSITDSGGDTLITDGIGNNIAIVGVSADQLTQANFRFLVDDEPTGNRDTQSTITPGTPVSGELEQLGDDDWYAVTFVAGVTYQINISAAGAGSGTLADSLLRIYDSNSFLRVINDSSGPGSDSFVSYTPSTTGTYYISVRADGDNGTGTYSVSVEADGVLQGTNNADLLIGTANNDQIFGFDGNDTIQAANGEDDVRAGNGDDSVTGACGDDTLFGEAGNDTLIGGNGDDSIRGGDGNDVVDGGSGDDLLTGGEGDDTIRGGNNIDTILGGGGNDELDGGDAWDVIYAGDGDDTIRGGDGGDNIYGEEGNDLIFGGVGDDSIEGGNADDLLTGGAGDDTVRGGNGDDSLYGSDGEDLLLGGNQFDQLFGGNGDDTLVGGAGLDVLTGGSGADIFRFGAVWDSDTIMDFEVGVDIIDMRGLDLEFDDLSIEQIGSNTRITVNGQTINLASFNAGDLSSDDFMLGDTVGTVLGIANPWAPLPDGGGEPNSGLRGSAISTRRGYSVDADEVIYFNNANSLSMLSAQRTVNNEGTIWSIRPTAGNQNPAVIGRDIDNSGTIVVGSANGNAGAVANRPGGEVANSGDIIAVAVNGAAIAVRIRDGVLDNSGTIEAWTSNSSAIGVRLDTDDNTNHVNSGDIVATGFSSAIGVRLEGGNDRNVTFDNSGSITATANGSSNSVAFQNQATRGFTLTNSGTISGRTAIESVTGSPSRTNSYEDSVINSGTIEGTVRLWDGDDTISNTGSITGNVILDNDEDLLDNSGTITGNVYLGGDDDSLNNTGTIRGFVDGSAGDDTINNSGIITGSVTLSWGNDNLNGAGGRIEGNISGGAGNDTIFGSEADDTILGEADDDLLDGGNGDDRIIAGTGADIIVLSNGDDTLTDFENGIDLIAYNDPSLTAADFTITQQGSNVLIEDGLGNSLLLHNTSAADVDANDFILLGASLIDGTAAADSLQGTDGIDLIRGLGGNDRIDGRGGDDFLTGGTGDDTFVADENSCSDTITDFGCGDDQLVISGLLDFSLTQANGDVIVTFDGSSTEVTIENSTIANVEGRTRTSDSGVRRRGSNRADDLTGTAADDEIEARGGNDTVRAGAGDDNITANGGDNQVFAGSGDDTVETGSGDDTVDAGTGDDSVDGGLGDDTILGGGGADRVFGGDGADLVFGGSGNDSLAGGADSDTIYGDEGDDTLDGGTGNDTLVGGNGDDLLFVGEADTACGDAGDDTLAATRALSGANLDGGCGDDLLDLSGMTTGALIDLAAGTIDMAGGNSRFSGFETVVGTAGADTLRGSNNDDIFEGSGGDDLLTGGLGNDQMTGGTGSDRFVFTGNWGDDTISDFTVGEDVIDLSGTLLSSGDVSFTPQSGGTLLEDGAGNSIFLDGVAPADIDLNDFLFTTIINGTSNADSLTGDGGNNEIWGGDGDDSIDGGDGADSIAGGSGDDMLLGGNGDDTLSGGCGDDSLSGGLGADLVMAGSGNDTVSGVEELSSTAPALAAAASSGVGLNDDLETGQIDVSDDGLSFSYTGGRDRDGVPATVELDNGQWYWEQTITDIIGSVNRLYLGILAPADSDWSDELGDLDGGMILGSNGRLFEGDGSRPREVLRGLSSLREGDVVGIAFDADLGALWISINGVWQNGATAEQIATGDTSGAVATAITGAQVPVAGGWATRGRDGHDVTFGFDAADLIHTVPTGFSPYGDAGSGGSTGASDTLDGGDGIDWIDFSSASTGIDMGTSVLNATGGTTIAGDIYRNFENIRGSGCDDVLNGSNDDNVLIGGNGDDTLSGGDGDDTLIGGNGDDSLNGGNGDDSLNGGRGDDTLVASSGSDTLDGGDGDDLILASCMDVIDGGSGDDTLSLANESTGQRVRLSDLIDVENILGSAYDDTLIGDGGDNYIGGADGADRLFAGSGSDTITGGDGEDYIDGGLGDDTLDGGNGDDTLYGNCGDDLLIGGLGDDLLTGACGDDTFSGGAGFDTVQLSDDDERADLATGLVTGSGGDTDRILDVEAVDGAGGDDTLLGTTGSDALMGGTGDDVLAGRSGDDTLTGGAGNDDFIIEAGFNADLISDFTIGEDTIDLSAMPVTFSSLLITQDGADALVEVPGHGTLTLTNITGSSLTSADFFFGTTSYVGTASDDTLTGQFRDETLEGLDGDDVLIGNNGDDTLLGGNGDDSLNGGFGADVIDGGNGDDTVSALEGTAVTGSSASLNNDLETNQIDVSDDGLSFSYTGGRNRDGVPATVELDGGQWYWEQTITDISGSSNNVYLGILAPAGSDWSDELGDLDGGLLLRGNGRVYEGDGNRPREVLRGLDRLGEGDVVGIAFDADLGAVWISINGVWQNGATAAEIAAGDTSGAVVTGITGAQVPVAAGWSTRGRDGQDVTFGFDAADQTFSAPTGFDPYGEAGGAAGGNEDRDTVDGGAGEDWIDFSAAGPVDMTGARLDDAGGAEIAGDLYRNFEHIIGSAGDDVLAGGDGDNELIGGCGDDTLIATAGDDTLTGGDGSDLVSFADLAASAFIDLGAGTAFAGGDTMLLSSIEHATGTATDDTLRGSNAANRLAGANGDDTIHGSAGADSLIGGAGSDHLTYACSDEGVTVDLGAGSGSCGDAEGDVISGFERLTGSNFNDSLAGDEGANTIQGGCGDDTLDGLDSNDLLFGGNGDDLIDGGTGNDTLVGGNGDDSINGGTGTDTARLSNDDDTLDLRLGVVTNVEIIDAGCGDDTIIGGSEAVHLMGGEGADVLVSGACDDTLTGGSGTDTFTFTDGWGNDTISDFDAAGETLDFSASTLSFSDLTITDTAGGALIEDTSGNSILLTGVSAVDVNASDFSFGTNVTGTPGDDILIGGFGRDIIVANSGNDTIRGGGSADDIDAGSGNDLISGGEGADTIDARDGDDTVQAYQPPATGDSVDLNDDLETDQIDVSDDGLSFSYSGGRDRDGVPASEDLDSGQWYWEQTITDISGSSNNVYLGILAPAGSDWSDELGDLDGGLMLRGNGRLYEGDGRRPREVLRGLDRFGEGDVVGIAFNADLGAVWISINGVWQNGATAAEIAAGDISNAVMTGITGAQVPVAAGWSTRGRDGHDVTFGFDAADQAYTPPTGFSPYAEAAAPAGDPDIVDGGRGFDIIDLSALTSGVDMTGAALGIGDATVINGATYSNFEGIIGTSSGDVLIASGDGRRLDGGDGDDTLRGGAGDDTLSGGDGDDVITGASSEDTLDGGNGDDTLNGGTGDDRMFGGAGNDSLFGFNGNDYIDGGSGNDTLSGADGHDTLIGGDGDDLLEGDHELVGGHDVLSGGNGDDTLNGWAGNDTLDGGDGDDLLDGANGDDLLIGGDGGDIFRFDVSLGWNDDRIEDFEDGTDLIEITGGVFTDLTIVQQDSDVLITHVNGSSILLIGQTVADIDENDFVF